MSAPAWCWSWRWWRSEPGMVVMEGDRQGQGGQAGWYEGGAGASSPLPSAQHHQVKPQCDLAMTTWYIYDLKISGGLHQREWELFQNDLQLHGKSVLHAVCLRWNTITRWVLNTRIKMTKPGWQAGIFGIKMSPSWKLCEHQPPALPSTDQTFYLQSPLCGEAVRLCQPGSFYIN